MMEARAFDLDWDVLARELEASERVDEYALYASEVLASLLANEMPLFEEPR
ncbi:MAG: hypothetical protein HYY16_01455 [Planctomycetes bacterium]|nr:hypothetical protein [Planctomycetota bacterium]